MARILGVVAAAALIAACVMLEELESGLVFRPNTADWAGYHPELLDEQAFWIPVGEGERIQGWWLEQPGAQYTLVYFHGARVNLTGSVYRLRSFRDAGFNVFAIDYRGFGRSSPRSPSEASVYEDALAAWRWLDARVPDRGRRILYGHSLGGVIAAEVALRGGGAAALVLEAAFTSIPDVTVFGPLVTQRMDLLDKVGRLDLPVLVVHGARDGIVPPAMAERIYAAARGPKALVLVEEAGHSFVVRRAGERVYGALRELLGERRVEVTPATRSAPAGR